MTMPAEADITIVESGAAQNGVHHYVDWPAIIAGIVLASAISIVLLAFGSALGLSLVDFDARDGASPLFIAIAAGLWLLWVQISSFMAGGYLTGRLRRRMHDASEHESDVRDGAHGLLVWAGALVLGAFIASNGLGALSNTVGSIASTATTAASNVAGGAAEGAAEGLTGSIDPNAYFVDTLFRPSAPAGGTAADAGTAPAATETPAATEAAPAAGETAATPAQPGDTASPAPSAGAPTPAGATPAASPPATRDPAAARGEAGRILAQGALTGGVSDTDRTYLAQVVGQETGMSEQEAQARVTEVLGQIDAARTEAAEVAETARKTSVLAAFLIAASFLVSGVGAYWAATKGGQHRDENTVFADTFRRF